MSVGPAAPEHTLHICGVAGAQFDTLCAQVDCKLQAGLLAMPCLPCAQPVNCPSLPSSRSVLAQIDSRIVGHKHGCLLTCFSLVGLVCQITNCYPRLKDGPCRRMPFQVCCFNATRLAVLMCPSCNVTVGCHSMGCVPREDRVDISRE